MRKRMANDSVADQIAKFIGKSMGTLMNQKESLQSQLADVERQIAGVRDSVLQQFGGGGRAGKARRKAKRALKRATSAVKRELSPATRRKMAAAARKRWARVRKEAAKAAKTVKTAVQS